MKSSILRRLVPLGLALGLIVTAFVVDTSLVALPAPAKADAVDQRSARTTDSTTVPEPPAASPEPTDPDAVPVEVVVVESTPLADALSTTGELRANESVELRSEVDGRLAALHFEEGQHVAEGALLVKIHDADLQAELRRAQVERRLAQVREERSRKLLDEDTISQAVYDDAKGELDVVDARIGTIEAEIAKTEIRAPFAGVIGLRSVSEGSYLTSSTPIATLQSLDPIKLDFSVAEKHAGAIRRGHAVDFHLAGAERTFTGEVYAVEPRIDPQTRTVRVRARAKNPGSRLVPGAFTEVRLVLAETPAMMVPSIALIPGLASTTVYVVENGTAVSRRVRLGRRTAEQVQVLEGLESGDQVIVRGIQQVRPGAAVAVRR